MYGEAVIVVGGMWAIACFDQLRPKSHNCSGKSSMVVKHTKKHQFTAPHEYTSQTAHHSSSQSPMPKELRRTTRANFRKRERGQVMLHGKSGIGYGDVRPKQHNSVTIQEGSLNKVDFESQLPAFIKRKFGLSVGPTQSTTKREVDDDLQKIELSGSLAEKGWRSGLFACGWNAPQYACRTWVSRGRERCSHKCRVVEILSDV